MNPRQFRYRVLSVGERQHLGLDWLWHYWDLVMPQSRSLRWIRQTVTILAIAIVSTGCLRYDLGIQFDHANHGQIVQQIRVGPRAAALAEPTLNAWLDDLERTVRRLGGQVRRQGDGVQLVLPFTAGEDLNRDLQQLFPAETTVPQLGQVRSRFALDQTNRLLAVYSHLIYDLDLQDLPVESTAPGQLAADWLEITFRLQTPWGFQVSPHSAVPEGDIWRLKPGQRYHIEATFWLPNLLGLGSAAIVLLVLLGYFLKYGLKAGLRR